jgi:hypothetical protein
MFAEMITLCIRDIFLMKQLLLKSFSMSYIVLIQNVVSEMTGVMRVYVHMVRRAAALNNKNKIPYFASTPRNGETDGKHVVVN